MKKRRSFYNIITFDVFFLFFYSFMQVLSKDEMYLPTTSLLPALSSVYAIGLKFMNAKSIDVLSNGVVSKPLYANDKNRLFKIHQKDEQKKPFNVFLSIVRKIGSPPHYRRSENCAVQKLFILIFSTRRSNTVNCPLYSHTCKIKSAVWVHGNVLIQHYCK